MAHGRIASPNPQELRCGAGESASSERLGKLGVYREKLVQWLPEADY